MLFLFYTAIHTSCLRRLWTSQRDLKGALRNLRASKWAEKPGESVNNWYSLIFKPKHVTGCCHLIIISQRRHPSFVAVTVNISGIFLHQCPRRLSLVRWRALRSTLLSWQWPPATSTPPLVELQAIWPFPSALWSFTFQDGQQTQRLWCSLWGLFLTAPILKMCLVLLTWDDAHCFIV